MDLIGLFAAKTAAAIRAFGILSNFNNVAKQNSDCTYLIWKIYGLIGLFAAKTAADIRAFGIAFPLQRGSR